METGLLAEIPTELKAVIHFYLEQLENHVEKEIGGPNIHGKYEEIEESLCPNPHWQAILSVLYMRSDNLNVDIVYYVFDRAHSFVHKSGRIEWCNESSKYTETLKFPKRHGIMLFPGTIFEELIFRYGPEIKRSSSWTIDREGKLMSPDVVILDLRSMFAIFHRRISHADDTSTLELAGRATKKFLQRIIDYGVENGKEGIVLLNSYLLMNIVLFDPLRKRENLEELEINDQVRQEYISLLHKSIDKMNQSPTQLSFR